MVFGHWLSEQYEKMMYSLIKLQTPIDFKWSADSKCNAMQQSEENASVVVCDGTSTICDALDFEIKLNEISIN